MVPTIIVLCSVFGVGDWTNSGETELAVAIAEFNHGAESNRIGASQPPLTEDEVVAAIRFWEKPSDAPISDELATSFRDIADTKKLPANAEFEKLTGFDRGGDHVFDVWSIRIKIERPDRSSYSFVIRERVVGSRTLVEELERLKSSTGRFANGERMPGWHRLETRIRELEKRIAEAGEQ